MIELSEPVRQYFDTEKSRDVEAQSRCFTDNALVHDEGRDYRGRRAIRGWKQTVQAKFEYDCEPIAATIHGDSVRVLVQLTGSFPGSPVELAHQFTIEGDKISKLVID